MNIVDEIMQEVTGAQKEQSPGELGGNQGFGRTGDGPPHNEGLVMNNTITPSVTTCLKSRLVDVLAYLFAWYPGLAMGLGRLVLRCWPAFREV